MRFPRRGGRVLLVLLVTCGLLSGSGGSGQAAVTAASTQAESRTEASYLQTSVIQPESTCRPASAQQPESTCQPASAQQPEALIPCRFVDARGFAWMLASTDETDQPRWRTAFPLDGDTPQAAGAAVGLILPHHDVAAPMTGRVLEEAADALAQADAMPETVILLGPNHAREGAQRIQTFPNDWDTPEGVMPAAREWAEQLARAHAASGDPLLMEREHALSYLVPWLRHAFPEATLLPVLISGALDREGCLALSETLSAFASQKRCLVVASIDFSHDQAPEAALAYDAVTWRHIRNTDAKAVLRLDNRHLDAPPTLATFLLTMEHVGAGDPALVGHAEASLFLGRRVDRTTSYLVVAWPP